MDTYARRTHKAVVELAPGESKTYRLPPITPGPIVVDAWELLPDRGASGPRVVEHRRPGGLGAVAATVVRYDVRGARLSGGRSRPTDLSIELVRGGISKAQHGTHLLAAATTRDSAWMMRLTRAAGTSSSGLRKYSIEASYPSGLPILEREIAPASLQRAFDAGWNRHSYLALELAGPDSDKLRVDFDPEFAALYGLENKVIDLELPMIELPGFRSTEIKFSMTAGPSPLEPGEDVPVVALAIRTTRREIWFEVRFSLVGLGASLGYFADVYLGWPDDELHLIDVKSEVREKLLEYVRALPMRAFGDRMMPWLVGEPGRALHDFRYDRLRDRIRVRWIGAPSPSIAELVVIDPARRAAAGPPAPAPPYLFDVPDEIPAALREAALREAAPREAPAPPPEAEPRRPYIASRGPLAAIQHIVVLMMHGRSFDQVLGHLSREGGRADVDGLSPDDAPHVQHYAGRTYAPRRALSTAWPGLARPGPVHDAGSVRAQLSEGMAHFVSSFGARAHADPDLLQLVMDYFVPEQLPAYAALAESFAICDRWFSSHAGPAWPNRVVAYTGDLGREVDGRPQLNQPTIDHVRPLQIRTLFDHLSARGIRWRLYEHGYSFLRVFSRYTFETDRVLPFAHPAAGFAAAARAGTLPRVTFIEPDYFDRPPGNDDSAPRDLADGQQLVASVVTAMMDGPQWQDSLLLVTYAEHGGFYDHVSPPDGPPLAGALPGYGPRVPAFVVSPFVGAGAVSHTVYDHTSIAATILRTFCSPSPPRLSPRADAAADVRELIRPARRPRAELAACYDRLVAIRDRPRAAPASSPRLTANIAPDDFHALLRYIATIT